MTNYALPSIAGIVGTFNVLLQSEFAGLTIPTRQCIKSIGVLEEVVDIKIGVTQTAKLSLEIVDDYTPPYQNEGFWYKVLNGDCRIRFYLDQGGGDTFYFFGVPQPETIRWTEYYIGSTRIRTVSVDLLSFDSILMSSPTIDWETEVVANSINTGNELDNAPSYKISVLGLFSAMLKSSGLNSTYSENDTSFIYNIADFVYNPGAGNRILSDLSIAVKMFVAPASHATTEYFSGSNRLSNKFAKLGDLLRHLLANFGVVLKMTYDIASSRHKIELIQRGRAYSTSLDFSSREKSSEISKSSDLIGDAVKATFLLDTTAFVWFSKKYLNGKSTAAVPNYVDFDNEFQCIFIVNGPISGLTISRSLWYVFGTTWTMMSSINYYNYNSGLFDSAGTNPMQEAIAGYLYNRFANLYSQITRRYGSLKANDGLVNDHTRLSILRRTTINDGIIDKVYYANKVKKNAEASEVEIEWIKE